MQRDDCAEGGPHWARLHDARPVLVRHADRLSSRKRSFNPIY